MSNLSNYPDGVTGREIQIMGGAEWESKAPVSHCPDCELLLTEEVSFSGYGDSATWWCYHCDADFEMEMITRDEAWWDENEDYYMENYLA